MDWFDPHPLLFRYWFHNLEGFVLGRCWFYRPLRNRSRLSTVFWQTTFGLRCSSSRSPVGCVISSWVDRPSSCWSRAEGGDVDRIRAEVSRLKWQHSHMDVMVRLQPPRCFSDVCVGFIRFTRKINRLYKGLADIIGHPYFWFTTVYVCVAAFKSALM